jgi:putative FmdB family regulatory protein
MPLYEYQCEACGHRFEVIQKYSDPPISVCPKCGGEVRKLFSSPAIQFKGSGFYLTDYGRAGKSDNAGKSDSEGSSGKESSSGSAEKKSDTAESKSEAKTESKDGSRSESKSDSKGESKSESKASEKPSASKPASD